MTDTPFDPHYQRVSGTESSSGWVQNVRIVSAPTTNQAVSSAPDASTATGDLAASPKDITTAQATLAAASGATSTAVLALGSGQSAFVADLLGSFSAGSTITVDASPYTTGGTTEWFPVTFRVIGGSGAPLTSLVGTGGSQAIRGHVSGWAQIRVRASVLAGGDVITVVPRATQGISEVTLQNPLDSLGNLKVRQQATTAAYGAATIGASAGLIKAANAARMAITIVNNGTVPIFIGSDNTVTTATGLPVYVQQSVVIATTTDLYGISTLAGQDVRYFAETA